jgi:hypothetical protein
MRIAAAATAKIIPAAITPYSMAVTPFLSAITLASEAKQDANIVVPFITVIQTGAGVSYEIA